LVQQVATESQVRHAQAVLDAAFLKIPDDKELRSHRIFNLLQLDPVFASLLDGIPAEVESQLDQILGPWYVGSYHALVVQPMDRNLTADELARLRTKNLHTDYPFGNHGQGIHGASKYSMHPSYPRTIQILFMLDNFTEKNGATQILPGSHRFALTPDKHNHSDLQLFASGLRHMEGKAGDLLVYLGQAWHAYGVNLGSSPRRALLVQCLPYYVRPMENHARRLPSRLAKRLSPKLRRRLGINWDFDFQCDLHAGLASNPVSGALLLLDGLAFGFPERMKVPGVEVEGWPAWMQALWWLFWQQNRLWVTVAVLAPFLCCCQPCRLPRKEAIRLMLAIAVGMVLGAMLILDRFRM